MRMQNTDMEFVTFDAQDVIATSSTTGGGPDWSKVSKIYMTAGEVGTINEAITGTFGFGNTWSINSFTGPNPTSTSNWGYTGGTPTQKATSTANGVNKDDSLVTGSKLANTDGYTHVDNLSDALAWLKAWYSFSQ